MTDEYEDVSQGADEEEPFIIDVDTTDAVQFGHVETGEYKMLVIKTEQKSGVGKNGPWKGFTLLMDIPEELTANPVSTIVFLPSTTGTEKQKERGRSDLAKFKDAFGFAPEESFIPSDCMGREPWAYLTVVDDPKYGMQNKVREWIVSQG